MSENCGLVGCMRCGNVPTPEQAIAIKMRHDEKMAANARATADWIDRKICDEVYAEIWAKIKPS